ncbi:ATP-binding cassette domain-containing protein [Nonomuraea wenchangensis]|uniref:ATP-binding cassette domain-containing protein n=1 Tax=Nonomuraea wenchangensis TaxID=568860 RepID=UPI003789F81F
MKLVVSQRLMLLRALRHVGAHLLAVIIALRTLHSLVPPATALVVSLLVQRLAGGDIVHGEKVAVPLALLGSVILAGRLIPELLAPLTFLAEQRIDGAQRSELIRLAVSSGTIDALERPDVQKLIRLARADREFWTERSPGQGAMAQLELMYAYFGVFASAAVLAAFAWWLVPLIVVPAVAARRVMRRQFLEHVQLEGDGIMDGLRSDHWKRLATEWTGGKEVRTFGLASWAADRAEHFILAKFAPTWAAAATSAARQWKIAAIVGPPLIIAYALVAWDGASGVNSVAAATAVFTASWSMLTMLGFADVVLIEGAIPGVQALRELQSVIGEQSSSAAPAVSSPGGDRTPPLIRFEDVSFTYPGTERLILDRVNLEIRPGELFAIVGLNGAGKSTLIKLLTGLYRPTSGRITADGLDIADIGLVAWRQLLCAVFQDFIQYQLPAVDNVTMGRAMLPARTEIAQAAADDTGLSRIIHELPKGWETPLSRSRRGGIDLSGGQWQKVVLTRALYALRTEAQVAVVDEPTAHLDVRAEAEVFDCLAKYHGSRTVVLITHRLSTVRRADRIVLLHDGGITEAGTHDELMAQAGQYAEMFTMQAARFERGYDDRLEMGGVS